MIPAQLVSCIEDINDPIGKMSWCDFHIKTSCTQMNLLSSEPRQNLDACGVIVTPIETSCLCADPQKAKMTMQPSWTGFWDIAQRTNISGNLIWGLLTSMVLAQKHCLNDWPACCVCRHRDIFRCMKTVVKQQKQLKQPTAGRCWGIAIWAK